MIGHLHDFFPQSRFELVTDAMATVAIASPWWLPPLKETSDVAALLLPIFGVLWIIVQIGFKIHSHLKKRHG